MISLRKINTIIVTTIILFCIIYFNVSCNKHKTERNKLITLSGEHICISLKSFVKEASSKLNANQSLPDSLLNLGGMSWLEGYVFDTHNSDIILIGKSINNRPAYQLEDLVVNFNNVLNNTESPYCSLDPFPENIKKLQQIMNSRTYSKNTNLDKEAEILQEALGPQKVVVGGVPRNSRHAFIMIDADYHMKKVSQGLLKLPGITSCLELPSKNDKTSSETTMSRFWFHIKNNDVKNYPNFVENDNIVIISECPVVLLTEKQLPDKDGNLHDVAEKNSVGVEFAKNMTERFSQITNVVRVYADLENLFRLRSLLLAMKFRDVFNRSDPNINNFIQGCSFSAENNMPETLPGLVNIKQSSYQDKKEKSITTFYETNLVAGGVGMDMKLIKENFLSQPTIDKFKDKVINLRPGKTTIFWRFQNV